MNISGSFFRGVLFAMSCVIAASANALPSDTLRASQLHPYGRWLPDAGGSVELITGAGHFGFDFDGDACQILARTGDSAGHNYIQYSLDGVYQKKLKISGNQFQPISIGGLQKKHHTVWIYKATEASAGSIYISGVVAAHVKALKEPNRPMIEFIGNSITCGAASDTTDMACDMGTYFDHHDAYDAYGPRVARALHANYIVSGVSGIGIYRNWNSDGPVMPQVYEKADFNLESTREWNFKEYSPRIVSIALGTNDFSDGDHQHPRLPFDSAAYVNAYVKFIQQVKSKYPKARYILLSSPMLNGSKRETLQNCLKAVKDKTDKLFPTDKPVALFFFQPMQPRGCGYHPSVADHAILAKQLVPAFKKLL